MFEVCRKQNLLNVLFAALLGLPALTPTMVRADASAQVLGAPIGEWSARWWQWAFGIPAPINPMADTTGGNCDVDQQGPVWFLAGWWGPPMDVNRTCTIPKGKSILFPIANYVWVQTSFDDPANTEADYRQCVSGISAPDNPLGCVGIAAVAGDLEATLDGIPVAFDYRTPIVRAQSPLFTVQWPYDNILGLDPANENCPKCREAVSDGFWVMLPPLRPGDHTLSFRAGDGTANWQNVTYHLIVTSKGSGHH
jgi:hypothetical protein